jgi:hypothetical protein
MLVDVLMGILNEEQSDSDAIDFATKSFMNGGLNLIFPGNAFKPMRNAV